jgi:hypothetical protein
VTHSHEDSEATSLTTSRLGDGTRRAAVSPQEFVETQDRFDNRLNPRCREVDDDVDPRTNGERRDR